VLLGSQRPDALSVYLKRLLGKKLAISRTNQVRTLVLNKQQSAYGYHLTPNLDTMCTRKWHGLEPNLCFLFLIFSSQNIRNRELPSKVKVWLDPPLPHLDLILFLTFSKNNFLSSITFISCLIRALTSSMVSTRDVSAFTIAFTIFIFFE
jgi:hypothetical protein